MSDGFTRFALYALYKLYDFKNYQIFTICYLNAPFSNNHNS